MAGDEPATTHVLPAHIQVLLAPQTSGRAGGKNSIGVRIAKCDTNELDSVSSAKLAHNVSPVNLNGVLSDPQLECDLFVQQTADQKRQHLSLSRR